MVFPDRCYFLLQACPDGSQWYSLTRVSGQKVAKNPVAVHLLAKIRTPPAQKQLLLALDNDYYKENDPYQNHSSNASAFATALYNAKTCKAEVY